MKFASFCLFANCWSESPSRYSVELCPRQWLANTPHSVLFSLHPTCVPICPTHCKTYPYKRRHFLIISSIVTPLTSTAIVLFFDLSFRCLNMGQFDDALQRIRATYCCWYIQCYSMNHSSQCFCLLRVFCCCSSSILAATQDHQELHQLPTPLPNRPPSLHLPYSSLRLLQFGCLYQVGF